ncbi:MAG: hypothetical protein EOM70_02115 [Clostridia bacterium]|nr:hypothetical protein [Clostridia bacterium]
MRGHVENWFNHGWASGSNFASLANLVQVDFMLDLSHAISSQFVVFHRNDRSSPQSSENLLRLLSPSCHSDPIEKMLIMTRDLQKLLEKSIRLRKTACKQYLPVTAQHLPVENEKTALKRLKPLQDSLSQPWCLKRDPVPIWAKLLPE